MAKRKKRKYSERKANARTGETGTSLPISGQLTISVGDSELVRAYHEEILKALVYVERVSRKTGKSEVATGTVFGWQGNDTDGWLPYILTAGHVVRQAPSEKYSYRLSRYSFLDPAHPTARVAVFETGPPGPRSPEALWYDGPGKHILDIGFIRGPLTCEDGKPFFVTRPDAPSANRQSAPIETDWYWAAEGTRVAWAGFPALATELAGRPQPCYYEGVVSALVLRDDVCRYLIDGHNTFGVSGGPVWAVSDTTRKARIVGVISSYGAKGGLPGLVCAAPIQPLRVFLEKNWGAKPSGPLSSAAEDTESRKVAG